MKLTKKDLSILIGNSLDHYDMSLYGLLVPIIAPLFFPEFNSIMQLILGYSLLATSLITKPFGIIFFSYLAEKRGAAYALSYSLIGVAISVILIGCLPTYNNAGVLAPILLIVTRLILDSFSAGESTIAKLYILEDKSEAKAKLASSIYQSSNIVGVIIASAIVTLITLSKNPGLYWRVPFFLGGITGFFGVYLRNSISGQKNSNIIRQKYNSKNILKTILKQRNGILQIAAVTSFGYVTYSIPFVFLNSYIPLISNISFNEMMQFNTGLLIIDAIGILIVARLIRFFEPRKVMICSCLLLCASILPLFFFIKDASILYISFIRFWIVIIGVCFSCFLNIWASKLFQSGERYLCVGIGSLLGGSTLGKLTTSICLSLWYYTNDATAPAYYVIFICLLTLVALFNSKKYPNIL